MAEDDRQLILGCRDRQEQAYHELMRRYEGYIYRLCHSFTGNREDALDLTQETFIKAFAGLGGYQLNRPFKPWLRRIAVNNCLDFLQKRGPLPLFLDQPAGENLTLGDTVACGDDPYAKMEWQETGRFLKEAVERLPRVYGLLLILRHQEGMSYQEIVEETGMPMGTVKTCLFRARAALRQELSAYYGWEV